MATAQRSLRGERWPAPGPAPGRLIDGANDEVVREIGEEVGLASPSTVHAHLANLERAGLIKRDPTKPRALEFPVALPASRRRARSTRCRSSGRSPPAGPLLAEQNVETYLSVPEPLASGGEEFLLRVRGDSMQDAGILEGDYVVVRRTQDARNGEIVVALAGDDESTTRRP